MNPIKLTQRNFVSLFSNSSVKLYSPKFVQSIIVLGIMTELLEKELIGYEIEFTDTNLNTLLIVKTDSEYILYNDKICECKYSNDISGVKIIYEYVRQSNMLSSKILWFIIILSNFYLNPDFDKEYCNDCIEFIEKIFIDFRTLKDQKIDECDIFNLPFTFHSNLLTGICCNIKLIIDNKYYRKNADFKIYTSLAKRGISIKVANEKYSNINVSIKNRIELLFNKVPRLVYKDNYKINYPFEQFILICYFLNSKNKIFDIYQSLFKGEYDEDKLVTFYKNLISLYKQLLRNYKKVNNCLVFRSNKSYDINVDDTNILLVLDHLLKIFIDRKNINITKRLMVFEHNDKLYLFSKMIDGNLIITAKENFTETINKFF